MWNLTRSVMVLSSVLVAGGLAVGCGSDGEGNGDVSTGLEPSKLLSDLTAEEVTSACEHISPQIDARTSREASVRADCTYDAVIDTDTPEACATQRDACIQQANSQVEAADSTDDCSEQPELSGCEGTVGQYETCINDRLDIDEANLNALDCADAAAITEENVDERFADDPASCEQFDRDACDL